MAFEIKDYRSILAGMINHMAASTSLITDFSEGSVTRTSLGAVSSELAQYYIRMWEGYVESVETSVFKTFDFPKLTAVRAYGPAVFSRATPAVTDYPIPIGSVIKIPGTNITYETIEAATLLTGNTEVTVQVRCTLSGEIGNTIADSVTTLVSVITGVTSVTNPLAFRTGADAETDDQRRLRFRRYIKTLVRGTALAVEYGATTAEVLDTDGYTVLERCTDANVVEASGSITVYVWNGVGSVTTDLVDRVRDIVNGYVDASGNYIQGYKCAGVSSSFYAASEVTTAVTCTIVIEAGKDATTMQSLVTSAINDAFAELGVGEDLLINALITYIQNVDGVIDVSFTTPLLDTIAAPNEIIVPGVTTVNI